jgi:hypothetical protein
VNKLNKKLSKDIQIANKYMKIFNILCHKRNVNQTTLRLHLTSIRIAIIKEQMTRNAGKDAGRNEPS